MTSEDIKREILQDFAFLLSEIDTISFDETNNKLANIVKRVRSLYTPTRGD